GVRTVGGRQARSAVHWCCMDGWASIAERKIREAMAQGEFDHLAGRGKPLDLEENPFEDPSLRMGHRLLRNNGFAPAWIEEAKDLQREIDAALLAPGSGEAFRARVEDLNRRIVAHNLKTPSAQFHMRTVDVNRHPHFR